MKATKVIGLLGRMLDANRREMYSTQCDSAMLWKMLMEHYQGKDKQRIWFLRSELSKVQYQGEDMSDFIPKLQKLLHQLLSAGCTAYEYDDKIFLLVNTWPSEFHHFRTSIPDSESLTFEEVSSRLILKHEMLAGGKAGSKRGGVAFYAENGKPSKGTHNQQCGNRSQVTCSYCHITGYEANDFKKRIKREDPRSEGSATERQAVAWMAQINAQDNAPAPTTLDRWIVESRALHNMTSRRSYFSTYYPDPTTVALANNRIVKVARRGDVVLRLPSGVITQKYVLHITSLGFSLLLSLSLSHQSGCQIGFNQPG